jgi:prepilin-type N-terminal cleavage/methylation domain-containing protein
MSLDQAACRRGLSLLEVMIAASILAGSAMVLSTIIGTGARFGNRAESKVTAIIQAHSILDESLARIAAGNMLEEYSGETSGPQPKAFQVVVTAMENSQSAPIASPSENKTELPSLLRVEVSLFREASSEKQGDPSPIVRLVQIARRPLVQQETNPIDNTMNNEPGAPAPSRRDSSALRGSRL